MAHPEQDRVVAAWVEESVLEPAEKGRWAWALLLSPGRRHRATAFAAGEATAPLTGEPPDDQGQQAHVVEPVQADEAPVEEDATQVLGARRDHVGQRLPQPGEADVERLTPAFDEPVGVEDEGVAQRSAP